MDRVYENLREVAKDFDAYLLDVWGVIHDGSSVYPGAVEGLKALTAHGRTLLLSNTPSTEAILAGELASRGCPREAYTAVLTSGEITRQLLLRLAEGRSARLVYYYIGPAQRSVLLEGAPCRRTDSLQEADLLLVTGLDDGHADLDSYQPILIEARDRGVPLYCANPDRSIVTMQGEVILCAGSVAHRYEELGGKVHYVGKPLGLIYEHARQRLRLRPQDRVVAIGDGLMTDVAGAQNAGIPALLLASGVAVVEAGGADLGRLRAFCGSRNIFPQGILKHFLWS